MQLALHIICRDEFEQVLRLIKSYEMFDEYAVAVDDELTCKKLKAYFSINPKVNIHLYEWDDDEKSLNYPKFDKKRNFLADKTRSEYYLRLDTDDYIERPENVRALFEKAISHNIDVVNTQYVYSRDMDGNTTSIHWRETLIRKDKNHYWKKNIHENIFVEDQSKVRVVRDTTIRIIHDIDEAHIIKSTERNIKFLLSEYEKDGDATDPRTLAYLGRMFMGVGRWSQAVFFLQKLIEKSGWQDDVYFAWLDMANCFQQLGNYKQALSCCNEALEIRTDWNLVYHVKAEIYLAGNDFDKCIDWSMVGFTKENPDTEGVYDPTRTSYRALMNISLALLHKGDIDVAKKYYDKAFKMAPSNEFIASNKKTFEEAYQKEQYLKSFIDIFNFTVHKDRAKAEKLIESVPEVMMTDMRIHAIRNKVIQPKEWEDNEIAIYCGQAWEDWAPPSVHRGIGGSEEAVINISQEFTKLGYKVTVFNTCGDFAGEYNGVVYKPYYSINPKDKFNIVIAWRNDIFSGFPVEAKKKIVWLHDVPMQNQFKPPYAFDKIIVLSQFHKTLLPKDIPEEKIFVSTNGINVKDFDGMFDRNTNRCIYTSSYDRGLETLLRIWPDVIKEVPEAELHIFYGWNLYDEMITSGVRPKAFKDMMVGLMNQPGIYEHGRIGHKKLAQEFLKSGVYAYPCHFEEISCISAMKAQAAGCVPVVTDYAALNETVKEGVKVHGKENVQEFKEKLIEVLKDKEKQEEIRQKVLLHKGSFGWDKVAESWRDNLFR